MTNLKYNKSIKSNTLNRLIKKHRSTLGFNKELVIIKMWTHSPRCGTTYQCSMPSLIPLSYPGATIFYNIDPVWTRRKQSAAVLKNGTRSGSCAPWTSGRPDGPLRRHGVQPAPRKSISLNGLYQEILA